MSDFASFDAYARTMDEGIDVPIKHPVTGQPTGLTLRVAGYESDRAKSIRRKQINEQLRNPRQVMTAEDTEERTLKMQAGVVLGWTWADGLTLDGVVPDFSPEAVERMFRRFPFVVPQVDAAASDNSRFLLD